ncbi:MAG: iron-sulfur cluster assembly scaffold protein [Bacillota bacterium]
MTHREAPICIPTKSWSTSCIPGELARGKRLEEALAITDDDVLREIGGLPDANVHCSSLGAKVLHMAIKDYLRKQSEKGVS